MADAPRGTFVLTQVGPTSTFIEYEVSDVNWYVTQGDTEIRITGSGKYTRVSGIAGWMHRLELDLSIDGADPEHFDSGTVAGGADFPNITDLVISMNGLYCYDIAIGVDAEPARVVCYRLGRTSTYQEGCLPPCLCPILAQQPLGGMFGLVELSDNGTVIEYAVVNVDWNVLSPYVPPSSSFEGFGRYTRISGFAGWMHQMELDLSIDGGPLTPFDSGMVNGGGEFPAINIALARNGFYCYDIILDIAARPCRKLAIEPVGALAVPVPVAAN